MLGEEDERFSAHETNNAGGFTVEKDDLHRVWSTDESNIASGRTGEFCDSESGDLDPTSAACEAVAGWILSVRRGSRLNLQRFDLKSPMR